VVYFCLIFIKKYLSMNTPKLNEEGPYNNIERMRQLLMKRGIFVDLTELSREKAMALSPEEISKMFRERCRKEVNAAQKLSFLR